VLLGSTQGRTLAPRMYGAIFLMWTNRPCDKFLRFLSSREQYRYRLGESHTSGRLPVGRFSGKVLFSATGAFHLSKSKFLLEPHALELGCG